MAKRSVLDHPKFTELQEALGQPKGAVLGWLECLWHFTAKFTPQGNVGKYSDKQIERWLEWDGEPGKLIECLLRCGWLDLSDQHRLIVHDWQDHCDDSVKKTLKRMADRICTVPVQTNDGQVADSSRLPEPSLAMPSQAKVEPPPPRIFENLPDPLRTDQFKAAWMRWEAYQDERYRRKLTLDMRSQSWARILTHAPPKSESDYGVLTIQQSIAEGWKGLHPKEPRATMAKAATVPARKLDNITDKRVAAQTDGETMLSDGLPLAEVMPVLVSRYGEDAARSAKKVANWR